MKRWISLLLVCLLGMTLLVPAAAEEAAANDPYEVGALEMVRQYMVRNANPAYNFTFNRNNTPDWPTGIILDQDDHRVLVVANDVSLTLMLSGEDDDMAVAAGYVLYEALMALETDMPDIYRRHDGAFEPLNLSDMGPVIRAYLAISGDQKTQYWCSLRRFPEDMYRDIIGRIMGNRGCACVIESVDVNNELVVADIPGSIFLLEDDDLLLVQSQNKSYLFYYSNGYADAAMALAMFNVLMGGVELEDMLVLRVTNDQQVENGLAISLVEASELTSYLEHFYGHWDLGK